MAYGLKTGKGGTVMRKLVQDLKQVPGLVLVGMVLGLSLALWIVVKAQG